MGTGLEMPAPPRTDVIGVGITATDMDESIAVVERWIEANEPHYLCFATVHSVMESYRDPSLRTVLNNSGMTTADGMPLAWACRVAGHATATRVCGPDFMLTFCERSASSGYRHYFYGGAPGVGDRLAARLQERFPGLTVVGTASPPFRALTMEEDAAAVAAINAAEPDIVWVGLGAPKQERWVADHRSVLNAPILAAVGAAFDFHSGGAKKAPQWMQVAGLEWVYRLAREPRRLWHRYLVYNPAFLVLLSRQYASSGLSALRRRPGPAPRPAATPATFDGRKP